VDEVFRLRWPGFGSKNNPELLVDRPVFEAAVAAVGLGQTVEGVAILESLGYKVTPLHLRAER
jgi:hypothetical protein